MRTKLTLSILILSFSITAMADSDYDWRKGGDENEKLKNLISVMPGAANLMLEMGERYKNLYWAARQKKWEFASYQAEEMKDLLETLMITRPKRAGTARVFVERAYPVLESALESRDWARFAKAFEQMRQECMSCHVKNDHGFIELAVPKRASSPVLNKE
jgi:hypothetical protein